MRKFYNLIVFILVFVSAGEALVWAQKPSGSSAPIPVPAVCGTVTPAKGRTAELNRLSKLALGIKQANAAANTITHLPIRPHIYRRSNGTGGFSLAALNNVIALTNSYYLQNGYGLQFYLAGTSPNYIDDDARYAVFNYTDEEGMVGSTSVNNALNQYYVQDFSNGIGGYAYFPENLLQTTRSFILVGGPETENDLGNRLIPHELGHNFGLLHTFERAIATERVTRNPGEVSPRLPANCTTAGDFVCDTPADPFGLPGASIANSTTPSCLTYTGTTLDSNGDAYNPLLTNIMSYYFPCKHDFTPGQYDRIQEALALRETHTAYTLNFPPTAVPAVTNLQASVGLSGAIALSWQDNASNEMGYFIERATAAAGPFVAIGGVAPDVSVFADVRVTTGQTYYYRVRPSNTSTGALSTVATVTATGTLYCRPGFSYGASTTEPDGLNAVFMNGETLSTQSGPAANGYNEYRPSSLTVVPGQVCNLNGSFLSTTQQEGISVWLDTNRNGVFENSERVASGLSTSQFSLSLTIPASVTAGQLAMRIIVLPNNIASATGACANYTYGEAEDYSITVQTGGCTIPTAPTVNPGITTASLSWLPASGATSYALRYKLVNSPTWINLSPTTTPTYSLTGLVQGTAYQWQVRSDCGGNGSPWVGHIFVSLCPDGPVSTTTSVLTEQSATLSWTGGYAPYEVRYRTEPDGAWQLKTGITTTTYNLTGLTSATTYSWQVRSRCSAEGGSLFTSVSSFTTPGYCRPVFGAATNCTDGDAITSFILSSTALSLNSGCSAGGYGSFTSVSATVRAGNSYTFTGTTASNLFAPGQGVAIWIDLNRNGQLETGERVYAMTELMPVGQTTFSGSFSIASGTGPGLLTMRILLVYGQIPSASCGNYNYGEAEDYRLQGEANCLTMVSVKDGNWNDPTVWSCGRVPTANDLIEVSHMVSLPAGYTGHAQRIRINTARKLVYGTGSQLRLGQIN
ncbi:hypothetical protein GGR92_000323 [Spirosoma lacussanchae]|uniref:GEVED domain-containing protein n=1 Tax=Spirosoma lacussanchae TaxID=1884249 RepID=UPI001108DD10|nr:GEVED domain-containing protein [Spirosoma lacussanchae]